MTVARLMFREKERWGPVAGLPCLSRPGPLLLKEVLRREIQGLKV